MSERVSCGLKPPFPEVVAICNCHCGVVVAIPSLPKRYEVAVVVPIKLPTVSCVPVAMSWPEELVVTMELIGSVARDESGTLETVSAPEELDSPEPRRLLNDEPFRMKLVVEAVSNDE